MLTNLLSRFSTTARTSAQLESTALRIEVCPPSLTEAAVRPANRWLESVSSWWRAAANSAATHTGLGTAAVVVSPKAAQYLDSTQLPDSDTRLCPRVYDSSEAARRRKPGAKVSKLAGQLNIARNDLGDLLADLHADRKRDLQWRIRQAMTLRELWHLRAEVFSLISMERDQSEAGKRLASVNHHFPVRAPRTTSGAAMRFSETGSDRAPRRS